MVGIVEIICGLVLLLIWVSTREPLNIVLAIALGAAGTATVLTARKQSNQNVDRAEDSPDEDDDDEDDDADPAAQVNIDRSTLPDEFEDDNRLGIDPAEVPTLESLIDWLDEQAYLPADSRMPKASWVLRLGSRRVAVLAPDGKVHYLVPAETPLHAGNRITAQYRPKG